MRNSTRRKGTPNSGSGEEGELAQKKNVPKGTTKHSQDSQKRWIK